MKIEFDYELAQLGYTTDSCEIVTRCGWKVVITNWEYHDLEGEYPLVGRLARDINSSLEFPPDIAYLTWTKDGKYYPEKGEHKYDLFIEIS